MKILVIEDNPDMAKMILDDLDEFPNVTVVRNVQKAVQFLSCQNADYDVVLTDMQMPMKDNGFIKRDAGIEVIRVAVALGLPVILMSSAIDLVPKHIRDLATATLQKDSKKGLYADAIRKVLEEQK